MPRARFRFYEELNDFLPSDRRKREFEADFCENATVKHAIEALGVPHTEVEVVLVNGHSVDFSHAVHSGDRVSVFPMFESLDVRPLLRVRPKPLRQPRFLADAHLGRLAGYLRMLGFDTLYAETMDDPELVSLATCEHRVLLTRDRDLLMHRAVTHGMYVRGRRPREQLGHVLDRLHLRGSFRPFSRCIRCNAHLESLSPRQAAGLAPRDIVRRHDSFRRCRGCGQVYWPGSHYRRMRRFVDRLREVPESGNGRSPGDRVRG